MDNKSEELIEITSDTAVEEPDRVASEKTDKAVPGENDNTTVSETESTAVVKAENSAAAENEGMAAESADDFAEDIEALEHESEDEEIMKNLTDSINRQVEIDLVNRSIQNDDAKQTVNEVIEHDETPVRAFLKKIPKWLKIAILVVMILGVAALFLACTGIGEKMLVKFGSRYVADKVNFVPVATLPPDELVDPSTLDEPDDEPITGIPEITDLPEPSATPEPTPTPVLPQSDILNVLLLGEEAIGSGDGRGRTDLIMLATVDTKAKSLKLTSFARDSLVKISGYSDNRINAAYAIGGVAKVYEVLRENFDIVPDNYLLVGFKDFEKIVDSVGGIDIFLSKNEAAYLNRTNYISNPVYRNVKEGANHLNGNQALGYCRVRKVSTKSKESNDFGRTSRQREVLTAIFNRIKTLGYTDLIGIAENCLPCVTTDMTAEQIESYINLLLSIGGTNVNVVQNRIPYDGMWEYVSLRGMSVTRIDIDKNKQELHKFIYGDNEQ